MRLLVALALAASASALVAPPTTSARRSSNTVRWAVRSPFGEGAAVVRVRAYFEAWNARDMDLACAQWSDDCTYEDTQYAGAFEGKAALEAHLFKVADKLPRSFAFVVDELSDGGDTVGVQWHVENGGEALPFTRGCSIYKAGANGLLVSGFDVPEPAPLKPGGAGLTLLSTASKLIAEPVRALPLACFLLYCQQLFLAEGQLLPGPNALQLDGATWSEVRDLSLNFWEVGPALFGGAFPVVYPGLEGIFNVVLAWSALFFGFAADGRAPRDPFLPTVAGMQFLTNAFLLPYLATRAPDDGAVAAGQLGPLERAAESRVVPLLLAAVGTWSAAWALYARPEFGDVAARTQSLAELLSGDRLGSSFLVDLGLYAVFQSWLVPDDLRRRGVEGDDALGYRALSLVPFYGLAAYLLVRPPIEVVEEGP